VSPQWLARIESAKGAEKARHHHLFLVKLLHECGHLLTPVFMKKLKYRKNQVGSPFAYDMPTKVGTIESRVKGEKHSRGEAGYGAEDELNGGRMFHEKGEDGGFQMLCLTMQKKKQKTMYEISDKFLEKPKLVLKDYRPLDSHLKDSKSDNSIKKTQGAAIFLPPMIQGQFVDISFPGHKA
jgi:hypothetical protein